MIFQICEKKKYCHSQGNFIRIDNNSSGVGARYHCDILAQTDDPILRHPPIKALSPKLMSASLASKLARGLFRPECRPLKPVHEFAYLTVKSRSNRNACRFARSRAARAGAAPAGAQNLNVQRRWAQPDQQRKIAADLPRR